MAYTRSFLFNFINNGQDDEIELLVLLGKEDIDPSTLFDHNYSNLIQVGHPISDKTKAEFHRLLSSVHQHITLPSLSYWVRAHQLILERADTLHHDRHGPSIWEQHTVSLLLNFDDIDDCSEAYAPLDYAPLIIANDKTSRDDGTKMCAFNPTASIQTDASNTS